MLNQINWHNYLYLKKHNKNEVCITNFSTLVLSFCINLYRMNKKYFLLFAIALCCFTRLQAQIPMYYYLVAPLTGTYNAVVGTPITLTSGNLNDGLATGIPIGFTFNFNGDPTPTTTVDVSTNGFATLSGVLGNSTPSNDLAAGLGGNRPVIAPLWDDLDLGHFNGSMSYATTGTAPNRIFTLEWAGVEWPYNVSSSAATATLSFEMKLYETSNTIDFIYKSIATSVNTGSQSASIGLAESATGPNEFISLNSTAANPAASYTNSTNTLSGIPTTGTMYRFQYCPPPTVTHSNVTINSFTSSWIGNAPLLYEYAMDSTWNATPATPVIPTTNLGHNFFNVMPNKTYYVYVRCKCDSVHYSPWVIDTVNTLPLPPCNAPLGLSVYGVTYTTANIIWTAVPGALSYQFVLNQSPVSPFIQGTPTALTYYNATNLLPGTTYYFHLRTDCSGYPTDTSAWETIQFTTLPLPPCQAPTGLYANNVTSTSADLGWNSQNGIIGWEFVLDQSTATPISGSLSTTNAITATGLTSLTTYYLHVRTDCSTYLGDTSNWVLYSFITLPDSCTQPTGLQISFVNQFTAFVSWNASPGAYAYEYIVDQNPNTPVVGGTPTFSTYHAVTGLSSSTQYYLHVRAVCDTAFYENNYTPWANSPFYTLPGLKVTNVTGSDNFIVAAFPNPVLNDVTVNVLGVQKGNSSLKVMDITGKTIKIIPVDGKDQVTFSMNDLSAGVYLLRYADNEQTYTLRLTKQ